MKRRNFLKASGFVLSGSAVLGTGLLSCRNEGPKPNILWITCEDMSPHLGCYGDTYAKTPNLDRLASESVRYNHAFATAPLCTPARSCLITGVFANTLGTQNLRGVQPLSSKIHCFTEYLRATGYYCSNNVKEDYNFETPVEAWDESSDTAHWRKRSPDKPFFSVFNLMTTHQSRTRYVGQELTKVSESLPENQRYDPATVPIPPYYPDTPLVRENLAALYTQVTIMDSQVQGLLDQLDADGLAEDTIVFFYSDHGNGLPRGKRWLHDTGIQVPLIVRFPEKYQSLAPTSPGGVVERMVSFVDFAPTVLSLAGLDIPEFMQGLAFLGAQDGQPQQYIVATRDRVDEVLEISRAIRDDRYKYIRNFMPHRPRMQRSFFSEMTPIRQEIRRLHAQNGLSDDAAYLMAPIKPAEELYDTRLDPLELNNLADSEVHQNTLHRLRTALFDWMLEARDSGLLPEADLLVRAAGAMPLEMAGDDLKYPLRKILTIADLVGRGKSKLPQLHEALSDTDSACRFWAATGLSALGRNAAPAAQQLLAVVEDEMSTVRFAAAEALCNIGYEQDALMALVDGLQNGNIYEQLHAAQIFVVIDDKARPAIPAMKAAIRRAEGLQDHGWYMREALTYLVDKLES